jgi:glucose/arabinose dehydrogenase
MNRKMAGMIIGLVVALTACTSPQREPAGSAFSKESAFAAAVRLETVAPEGTFDRPVGMERRPGHPDKLYVVEQAGTIRILNLKQPSARPAAMLDITDRVKDDGNEKGLLGLAFHPSKPEEAYVNYTTATHTVISRFTADPSDPQKLDPSSEKVILTFPQPHANHNGGQLAFGPDGLLYIATGDGGGAGDPQGNGQNTNSLLGKILRLDIGSPAGNTAYGIPAENPFAGGGGAPEVYAYGLRNPWRFSFDSATGKLWAADVGQNRLEEINIIEKGGNYGWNIREGTACYQPSEGCASVGMTAPVHEYDHDLGVSVTGGYVYHGRLIPELDGWYVYADYATGTIWALRQDKDGRADNRTLLESQMQITSFGIDTAGEIYVVAQDGGIHQFLVG